MKIAGIVAEYNPFHNGHAHQIASLRARGFDAVVCVCSPCVVQRGTAALLPTAVRTHAALLGGVDLVLCLPAPYATLSAEGFAQAGVRLLAALGSCDTLAFGAEATDTAALLGAAQVLRSAAFSHALPAQLTDGTSFPVARAAAAEAVQPGLGALLRTPNNILGVEYCKALLALEDESAAAAHRKARLLRPLALPREGAQHDAPLSQAAPAPPLATACSCASAPAFASATALRALCLQQDAAALAPYVPAACLVPYAKAQADGLVTSYSAFGIAVLSRLRGMHANDFACIRGATEGLEHRLATAVRVAPTLDALYDALKTKRYPHARLRRLVLDAALGYTAALPPAPPYLHVLGASEAGLAVLKASKNCATLPLSQSLSQLAAHSPAAHAVAHAHAAAEDLTALCLRAPQPQGGAFTQKFIAL